MKLYMIFLKAAENSPSVAKGNTREEVIAVNKERGSQILGKLQRFATERHLEKEVQQWGEPMLLPVLRVV